MIMVVFKMVICVLLAWEEKAQKLNLFPIKRMIIKLEELKRAKFLVFIK